MHIKLANAKISHNKAPHLEENGNKRVRNITFQPFM